METTRKPVQRRIGRPTREDAAEIDELLLDRTLNAIQRGGFATLSLDSLALEIGVTKQTIYRRFPSKVALIDATVERELMRLETAVASFDSRDDDPINDLKQLARLFFEITTKPEAIAFALYMDHGAQTDAGYRARQRQFHAMTVLPFQKLVSAAQRQGRIHDGDPDRIVRLMFDLLGGAARRLQMGLDPHVAYDDQSADDFFASRFGSFITLVETKR